MSRIALDHAFISSRNQCQSLLEACFGVDPDYIRPILQTGGQRAMSWFMRDETGMKATLTAWISHQHPATGTIGLARGIDPGAPALWESLLCEAEEWLLINGARHVQASADGAAWHDYKLGIGANIDHQLGLGHASQQALLAVMQRLGYQPSSTLHAAGMERHEFPRLLAQLRPASLAASHQGVRIEAIRDEQRDLLLSSIFDISADLELGLTDLDAINRVALADLYRHFNSRRNISISQLLWQSNGQIGGFLYAYEDHGLMVIKSIGVLPAMEKSLAKMGISPTQALLFAALNTAEEKGLQGAVAALICDSKSDRILRELKLGTGNWQRQHRLYHRLL